MKYIILTVLVLTLSLNAQSNKKYWDNKEVQIDISIKNGKPDGIAKFYHDNGQLYLEIEYKNGKVSSSEVKLFSKDGKLLCINHYKNSYPDGEYKTFLFQKNMQVLFDGSYKDGKFTGIEKTYHNNETLKSRTSYKDGKKNGARIEYNSDGTLAWEGTFKTGKLIK